MPETSARRFSLLPMLGHTKGKRSPVTCALKCDNACAGEVCNTSSNSYFRDIASATMLPPRRPGASAPPVRSPSSSACGGRRPDGAAEPAPAAKAAAKEGFAKSKLQFTAIAPVPPPWTPSPCPRASTGSRSSAGATRCSHDAPDFDLGQPDRRRPVPASSATTTTTWTSSRFRGSKGTPCGAVRQPRVHQRGHHVPGRSMPRRAPARGGRGRARPVRRRAGAQEQEPAVALRPAAPS